MSKDENSVKKYINENGMNSGFIVLLLAISLVGFVFGGMHIHECTTKKDDTTNYWLYVFTSLFIVLGTIVIARSSYIYGQQKITKNVFIGSCIVLTLSILVAQIGVFNAIATPNTEGWNEAGKWLGSILVVAAAVFLGGGGYFAVKKYQKK